MRMFRRQIGVICLFLFSCVMGFGQAASQISGTAKDPSGAVVPGVEISATQTETGVKRTTTTDESGNFTLPNLPLGPYRIEGVKMGFRTFVQTGLVLQVGSAPEIPIQMGVGQVSDSVQVEANAAQIETRSVGVGNVIETQRILELPLNGRQPTDLITLSGAAVQTAFSPAYTMRAGVRVAVAGGHEYSVQYNLDGASHLETYGGTGMPLPFPEALQEFKLVTSTQDASGSGHSGASVNGVTKSGTNTMHGDVFYFIRNAALNGRDFFARTNDKLKRNQFGGVVGGAIIKDKLFYFVGYQGTTVRQTPSGTQSFVPTAKMLQGDYSDYVANKCGSFAPGILDATNHLTLPISPAAANISKLLPTPLNSCGLVITGTPISENQLQVPVRLDYQVSDKQSLFARYIVTRIDAKLAYDIDPTNVLNNTAVGSDDMAQSLAFGDTYVFGPAVVNSFRVYGNRVGSYKPYAHIPGLDPSKIGIKNFYTYLPDFMAITVPGAFNLGANANFSTSTTGYTNFGMNEDINWIRGAHQFSFGVNYMRAILVGNSYAWAPGVFAFTGGRTGNALTDFLVGSIGSFHQANPNPNYTTQNFLGAYAGDVWKVNSRLTVNYGVRWNPFIPVQFTQSDGSSFDLSNFVAGKRSTAIPSAPPGFLFAGDSGYNGRSGMNSAFNHFEPRVGFAFDPFGDGKTSIRGSVGNAYDFIFQGIHQNSSSNAPFRLTILNAGNSLDDPYAGSVNPFPYTFNPKSPSFPYKPDYQGFLFIPPDLRTTQQYQWNLGIQRQITPSLFASATYLGTHLIHTWNAYELNPGQFIPGNCSAGQYGLTAPGACSQLSNINQRRLLNLTNPTQAGNILGYVTQMDDGGTQSYNALLVTSTYRKGNVNLSGNWTFSHCIGLPYTTVANLGAAMIHGPYQNNGPVDRNIDTGNCVIGNLDQRHVVNVTAVVNTGKGKGNSMARHLTSNWSVSTIYTVRTGFALTPYTQSDRALNGMLATAGGYQTVQRPNQIDVNTDSATRGQSCTPAPCVSWFNPASFAQPALGTYGNMGSGSLRGPGFWEWDQAIIRDFRVTEKQSIEFRAEAFNLTNSVRYYMNPAANGDNSTRFGAAAFGTITAAASTSGSTSLSGSGGRVIQFALKYVF